MSLDYREGPRLQLHFRHKDHRHRLRLQRQSSRYRRAVQLDPLRYVRKLVHYFHDRV